jgi:hypothetical protein
MVTKNRNPDPAHAGTGQSGSGGGVMLGHLAFGVICGGTAALYGLSFGLSGLGLFLAYSLGGNAGLLLSLSLAGAPQGAPS